MAQYTCPSCGQPFNGKKCRSCMYEQYEGSCPPGKHTHTEKPAAVDVHIPWTPPKTIQKAAPKAGKKARKAAPRWLIWALIAVLLEPGLDILGEVLDGVGSAFETSSTAIVSVALPENAREVFSTGDYTLYIGSSEDGLYYPLYLDNAGELDVSLSARAIVTDGFLTERSYIYCDAPAGTTQSGSLYLEEEDIRYVNSGSARHLEVWYAIYDADSYEDLLEGSFSFDLGGTPVLMDPGGETLVDADGVQIRYLGYEPDPYEPDLFGEGNPLLYIENNTGCELSFYVDSATIDGMEGPSFWTVLPANTRTVSQVFFFGMEDKDLESIGPDSILEMTLTASSNDESFGYLTLDTFSVPLA